MTEKNNRDANTRAFSLELELEHPVDTVWRAITDPDELVRWFPRDARVEPGEGGSVWLGWGDRAADVERFEGSWRERMASLP